MTLEEFFEGQMYRLWHIYGSENVPGHIHRIAPWHQRRRPQQNPDARTPLDMRRPWLG